MCNRIAVPRFFLLILRIRLPTILPHRVATHLDAVSVVNQPVEDAVRQGRIADLLVPARNRKLRAICLWESFRK
jgi:hypothetical protein